MRVLSTQQIPLPALAIIALIAPDCCHAEQPKIGRGKSWGRSHPFWISGLTQNGALKDVIEYRGAGLNTLLAWKPRPVLIEKSVAAPLLVNKQVLPSANGWLVSVGLFWYGRQPLGAEDANTTSGS